MILTKYDAPHQGRRVGDWIYQPSAFISGIGAGFTDLAYTHNPESAERAFVSIYNLQMSQKLSFDCRRINSAIEITNSPHGVGALSLYGRYFLRPLLEGISVLTRPIYK